MKTPLKLAHNQQIRVKGFIHAQKITVGTIAGCALQNGENTAMAIIRANKFGNSLNPWTNQAPAVLTAHYKGKEADLAAAGVAKNAAPEIADGDIVEIESKLFTVVVLGQRYSDPVAFRPF